MQPNPLRRRRRRSDFFEDPQQFLWAISYSDLLMVLMSFFVIYFEVSNVKDTPKDKPLSKIIFALKDKVVKTGAAGSGGATGDSVVAVNPGTGGVDGPGTGTGTGTGTETGAGTGSGIGTAPVAQGGAGAQTGAAAPAKRPLENVMAALKAHDIESELDTRKNGIMIHFPANIYREGDFAVDAKIEKRLLEILDPLKEHRDEINITFIGHTDTLPVKRLDRRIIDSNLVLSNLRASRAAEVALKQGFDPRWVSAQGVGEFARNTRSLSIRISERETEARK